MSNERQLRWETWTNVPFLAAYAWPILDPGLPSWAARLCWVTSWAVWALFAADFGVRLALAEQRRQFLRRNWLDVLTLAVPMLRPLRALRVVVALNILGRRGGHLVRSRVVAYVAGAGAGFVAALAVVLGYEGEQATITVAFKRPKNRSCTTNEQQFNRAHNAARAIGERGNSLLKTTFKALRNVSLCPWTITRITTAALVILHIEHGRTT